MRRLDELSRFCNELRSRLPQSAWSWPLIAAVAGALFVLIGTSPPDGPATAMADDNTTASATKPAASAARPAGCENETWPYLSKRCLRGAPPAKHVRVLLYEPALAVAAIGATKWAHKAMPSSRQQASRHKQATRGSDRERTVTVDSGRRDRGMR